MRQAHGDLIKLALAGQFDVIVHGANCMCTMGAGIAKQISAQLPEAYAADRLTTPGDPAKLGTITTAQVVRPNARFVVVNAYTQFDWRGGGVKVDYDAVRSSMRAVAARFKGQRIGYPQIGAGLAGGYWPAIARIIEAELEGLDHTLVVFEAASRLRT